MTADTPYESLSYQDPNSGAQLVGLVDMNGDGLPDRVMRDPNDSSHGSRWMVQLNTGNAGSAFDVTLGGGLRGIASGDLDGDEVPDLVVSRNDANNVRVLYGLPGGGFDTRGGGYLATGRDPRGVAIGNFDGDEYLDIAVANFYRDSADAFLKAIVD